MNTDLSTLFNKRSILNSITPPEEDHNNTELFPSSPKKRKNTSLLPEEDLKSFYPPIKTKRSSWKKLNTKEHNLLKAIKIVGKVKEKAFPIKRQDTINATDVYCLHAEKQTIFFKPKRTETDIASLSYSIARIIGLENAVPPTMQMNIPAIVTSRDENHQYLILRDQNGESFLVNSEATYSLSKSKNIQRESDFFNCPYFEKFDNLPIVEFTPFLNEPPSSICYENYKSQFDEEDLLETENPVYSDSKNIPKTIYLFGFTFSVTGYEEGELTLKITPKLRKNINNLINEETLSAIQEEFLGEILDYPTLSLMTSSNGGQFLCHPNLCEEIKEKYKNITVNRDDRDFIIEKSSKGFYRVVGYNVEGVGQLAVPHLFDGGNLDITQASPEREAFYNRIDFESFVDCFLTTILLRPEDGKIEKLSDANYLFELLNPEDPNSPLAPRMIDLEDSFPVENEYNVDLTGTTHAVKTGLMGFPHVRKKLSNKERINIEEKLFTIIFKSNEFSQEFENAKLSKVKQDSFFEIIKGIDVFLKKNRDINYTLQDLFFFIFPEYSEQWKMLEDKGFSPEEIASKVGNENVEFWKNRYKIKITKENTPLTFNRMQINSIGNLN